MTTLQARAAEARRHFEFATRPDGTRFWRCKDGAPEWVRQLCYAAHQDGAMLPDDYRYMYTVQSLEALAEHEDPDGARATLEANEGTADLAAWLGSHAWRPGYCDDAAKEWGDSPDTLTRLQRGQLFELHEVFDMVARYLAEHEGE